MQIINNQVLCNACLYQHHHQHITSPQHVLEAFGISSNQTWSFGAQGFMCFGDSISLFWFLRCGNVVVWVWPTKPRTLPSVPYQQQNCGPATRGLWKASSTAAWSSIHEDAWQSRKSSVCFWQTTLGSASKKPSLLAAASKQEGSGLDPPTGRHPRAVDHHNTGIEVHSPWCWDLWRRLLWTKM